MTQDIFAPTAPGRPPKVLVVAGACGTVGFGKLGQFAKALEPRGISVIALDRAPAVLDIHQRLAAAYGDKIDADKKAAILARVQPVCGAINDIPASADIAFVFEAIPEKLALKREFYSQVFARAPEAFVFSATSGFPSRVLFDGMTQATQGGVLHPFFPHLTNRLWEFADADACTGSREKDAVRALFGELGMTLVPVRDVPAFAADRIFCGLMLEAVRIHDELGLSPAQVDDVSKQVFGSTPFFVHNLIFGANGLSLHCMELLQTEADSTLYRIPAAWRPYAEDPNKKWPYVKGEQCPPESVEIVRARLLGMVLALTSAMLQRQVVAPEQLDLLCEQALGFREGPVKLMARLGAEQTRAILQAYIRDTGVTLAEQVAPLP